MTFIHNIEKLYLTSDCQDVAMQSFANVDKELDRVKNQIGFKIVLKIVF